MWTWCFFNCRDIRVFSESANYQQYFTAPQFLSTLGVFSDFDDNSVFVLIDISTLVLFFRPDFNFVFQNVWCRKT